MDRVHLFDSGNSWRGITANYHLLVALEITEGLSSLVRTETWMAHQGPLQKVLFAVNVFADIWRRINTFPDWLERAIPFCLYYLQLFHATQQSLVVVTGQYHLQRLKHPVFNSLRRKLAVPWTRVYSCQVIYHHFLGNIRNLA